MFKLQMKHLENCFKSALENGSKYVAVVIEMEGFSNMEIIINPLDNVEDKLAYYKNTYDNDLQHKFSKGISIVGCTFGNNFAEIEDNLLEDM